MLYRGVQLAPSEIRAHVPRKKICLQGYTSTSKDRQVALNFATDRIAEGKVAVIYEIEFKGTQGIFFMSSRDFSAHPEEHEVLVQDGLEYLITSVQELMIQVED